MPKTLQVRSKRLPHRTFMKFHAEMHQKSDVTSPRIQEGEKADEPYKCLLYGFENKSFFNFNQHKGLHCPTRFTFQPLAPALHHVKPSMKSKALPFQTASDDHFS